MIEKELYKHLHAQSESLGQYMAIYREKMAIFNQEAPADTDDGWESKKSQYGRIVFALDLTDDPEREYSGTLAVDVMCEDGKQVPEDLEPIVRSLIDGYFFNSENITIAAQWSASNYFTTPTEKIVGVTLTFGLLSFPKQTTIDPDPIALFNQWTEKELASAIGKKIRIIGHDAMEPAWKPTNEEPAIYWRLATVGPCGWIPDTYNCSWQTAVIYGHIMVPDKDVAAIMARMISNILTLKRRLIFEDMSPLMVDRNIRVNLGSDQLRTGQITIDATYGILNVPKPCEQLSNLYVKGKEDT